MCMKKKVSALASFHSCSKDNPAPNVKIHPKHRHIDIVLCRKPVHCGHCPSFLNDITSWQVLRNWTLYVASGSCSSLRLTLASRGLLPVCDRNPADVIWPPLPETQRKLLPRRKQHTKKEPQRREPHTTEERKRRKQHTNKGQQRQKQHTDKANLKEETLTSHPLSYAEFTRLLVSHFVRDLELRLAFLTFASRLIPKKR